MFEQTFKNIDDILFKDAGADSELDYIGQTSWVMFLRYLDELEAKKADEAGLKGEEYNFIIDEEYRWNTWATPKGSDGKIDYNVAITGPDLVEFVNLKLFPYMAGFKQRADNPKSIKYKIGEIFSELKNKIQSGYNLREILELADKLEFRLSDEQHELSTLYETKIKNMGNAGRNGGQYYTPRALIRSIIAVVDPQIGETVYDGAVGSAGFLCESFDHMSKARDTLSTDDLATLKEDTFYGKEKKNLAYIIGVMNMILHGIEAPNIIHTNTLSENLRDIQEKDSTTVFTPAPKNVPPGISKMVCKLHLVSKCLRSATAALSVLLKKVFLITIPARPPAFKVLIKCCKNRNAVSPVLMSKFCCTSARSLPPKQVKRHSYSYSTLLRL